MSPATSGDVSVRAPLGRTKLLPWWHAARPFVLGGLVAGVLVLGTIGFQRLELPHGEHYGFWDSLFRALRLFGLEGIIEPRLPWQLLVAGIVGPVLTGYAAALALLRLFRTQAQLLGIRLFYRGHVIVVGLGTTGTRLAHAFHAEHRRVVAVDAAEPAAQASGCAERGIPVLVGNAADAEVLGNAGIVRASQLVVATGDDSVNLDVSLVARRLVPRSQRGILNALVHVTDLALWHRLSADAITGDHPAVRLEFFNVPLSAARLMVDSHPPDGSRLCLVGVEELGQDVLLHLAGAWRARGTGAPLPVIVAGPEAAERVDGLVARHPDLESVCELDVRSVAVESALLQTGEILLGDGGPPARRAFVCLPRAAEALSVGLGLRRRPDTRDTHVVVALPDAETGAGRALREEAAHTGRLDVFGVLNAALTPQLIGHGLTEAIARAKHADYVRAERAKGVTPAQNASMAPWDELPESLRDSNRRFADGVGATLRALGCAVVPAPLIDPRGPLLRFGPDEVERLAREEHDRWARDLRRDGWQPTDGPKDPDRKLHPLLVSWEELSEEEREKDRDPVRALPRMLAEAGLEVRRVQGGASASRGD
jgi:hypothetical protein